MGAVFRARQDRPRRTVAVKVLRPQLASDAQNWPIFMARFQREADATAALDHANIVPIYEFGQEQNIAYLVMPYLPDGSLADLLVKRGRLSIEETLRYLAGAAAALDYAHSRGIIHRDVKPSNLLIHPDRGLMLGDFGIARPLDLSELPPTPTGAANAQLTQAGVAMGTPEFMAPEQIRGSTLSAQTDIYGLGIVAYTTLTGHTPFSGTDVPTTLARQLREPPQSIRRFRPDVSPGLEQAIFLALAKEPGQRPKSATEFVQMAGAGAGIPFAQLQPHTTGRIPVQRAAPAGSMTGVPPVALSPVMAQAAPPGPPMMGPGLPPNTVAMPHLAPAAGVATAYDMQRMGGAPYNRMISPGGAPAWPVRRMSPPATQRGSAFGRYAMVVVAAVAVVALLFVGALYLNALAQNNPSGTGSNPAGISTTKPSPSPSPTTNSTPVALTPSTTSITLGCSGNGGDLNQTFQLTNSGSQDVQWSASIISQSGSAHGISVTPKSGNLLSGESTPISVTYVSPTRDEQGYIKFKPNDNPALAVIVQYTAQSCGSGN